MPELSFYVNGQRIGAKEGSTVAAALLAADHVCFRTSLCGSARAPLCGMGVCFECRVSIDGKPHQRSCQIPVRDNMTVQTT